MELIALEVLRHHRLLELYLIEFLSLPWEVAGHVLVAPLEGAAATAGEGGR